MSRHKIIAGILTVLWAVAVVLVAYAWVFSFMGKGFGWKTTPSFYSHRILAFADGTIRYTYRTTLSPLPSDDPAFVEHIKNMPPYAVYQFTQPTNMVSTLWPVAVTDMGTHKHVRLSLYYPTLLAIGPTFFIVRRELRKKRVKQRRKYGLCTACGYDLRGSQESGCCPECGSAIIQSDARAPHAVS